MPRIIEDGVGNRYALQDPVELTTAPDDVRLATESEPWKNYWRMLGTVLLAFLILYWGIPTVIIGVLVDEPIVTLIGGVCSILPLPFLFLLHKPKMVHVRFATPDSAGKKYHPLPEGGSLYTSEPTSFSRFLTPDDSILDLPPHRQVWVVFTLTIIVGILATLPLLNEYTETIGILLYLILALPLWVIGFSIPVFAWWATSSKWLGLPTRRRDAEAWLIAGMASALPALMINSFIFPTLMPSSLSASTFNFLMVTISAPIGEETCKLLAVCLFLTAIRSPRHGFQVGFTVGLGFALLENCVYVMGGMFGGPFNITLTTLVRGIGSIPGHAVWTGVSGFAIGCLASETDIHSKIRWRLKKVGIDAVDMVEGWGIDLDGDGDTSGYDQYRETLEEALNSAPEAASPSWMLVDGETGEIHQAQGVEDLTPVGTAIVTATAAAQMRVTDGVHLLPPRNVFAGLGLAMSGHAIWNGSSSLVSHLGPAIGLGSDASLLLDLAWIVVLVATVLTLAKLLMKSIRTMPAS